MAIVHKKSVIVTLFHLNPEHFCRLWWRGVAIKRVVFLVGTLFYSNPAHFCWLWSVTRSLDSSILKLVRMPAGEGEDEAATSATNQSVRLKISPSFHSIFRYNKYRIFFIPISQTQNISLLPKHFSLK